MLHRDTEGGLVAPMSTHSRRRAVDHEAAELGRLLAEVHGEGAGCVYETLASDRKTEGVNPETFEAKFEQQDNWTAFEVQTHVLSPRWLCDLQGVNNLSFEVRVSGAPDDVTNRDVVRTQRQGDVDVQGRGCSVRGQDGRTQMGCGDEVETHSQNLQL